MPTNICETLRNANETCSALGDWGYRFNKLTKDDSQTWLDDFWEISPELDGLGVSAASTEDGDSNIVLFATNYEFGTNHNAAPKIEDQTYLHNKANGEWITLPVGYT